MPTILGRQNTDKKEKDGRLGRLNVDKLQQPNCVKQMQDKIHDRLERLGQEQIPGYVHIRGKGGVQR